MLTGDNGILKQATNAKEKTENAQMEEENTLTNYEQIINTSTGVTLETITGTETSNTVTQDSLGNRVVVPAGFRVVNPTDNVEDGIIIEDVSHGATEESQFVWIPVGKGIKKKDGSTFDIKLSRYTFTEDGTPSEQGSNIIETWYQELNIGKGNITTKENIEDEKEGFRKSAIANGGYYIGRYEARDSTTEVPRTFSSSDENRLVCIADNYVYNYVTQLQAASLSQNMYNSSNFKSDLMNSYAWDTAIDFLQKCDDRADKTTPYSRQTSLNIGSVAEKGTNGTDTEDVICNVFDMASNCFEWTTETFVRGDLPCVGRGGYYNNADSYTSNRYSYDKTFPYGHSFRPILYL